MITRQRILLLLKKNCRMRVWCAQHNDKELLVSLKKEFEFWKKALHAA